MKIRKEKDTRPSITLKKNVVRAYKYITRSNKIELIKEVFRRDRNKDAVEIRKIVNVKIKITR